MKIFHVCTVWLLLLLVSDYVMYTHRHSSETICFERVGFTPLYFYCFSCFRNNQHYKNHSFIRDFENTCKNTKGYFMVFFCQWCKSADIYCYGEVQEQEWVVIVMLCNGSDKCSVQSLQWLVSSSPPPAEHSNHTHNTVTAADCFPTAALIIWQSSYNLLHNNFRCKVLNCFRKSPPRIY